MRQKSVTGMLLDDESEMSLSDLSRACRVNAEWIIALVEEGILEPIGEDAASWRFSAVSLIRVHTVIRLQRDLHINLSGAALALELLDEIDALRTRLSLHERN